METILEQKAEFKNSSYTSQSFLELTTNKIITNLIDEHHKSNELDLIICGKTDLYIIKETIKRNPENVIAFMEF